MAGAAVLSTLDVGQGETKCGSDISKGSEVGIREIICPQVFDFSHFYFQRNEQYAPFSSLEPIVAVENVHVTIAGKEVLKGINLTINEGETHVLFGPNGSGKSTLIKTIMGLRYAYTPLSTL